HGQAGGQQAVTHHFDLDASRQAAPDIDGADARNLLETFADFPLQDGGELHQVAVGLDTNHHHRQVVRVELVDARRIGVLGEAVAHAVQYFAHIVAGFGQVSALGKAQADAAFTFAGA